MPILALTLVLLRSEVDDMEMIDEARVRMVLVKSGKNELLVLVLLLLRRLLFDGEEDHGGTGTEEEEVERGRSLNRWWLLLW